MIRVKLVLLDENLRRVAGGNEVILELDEGSTINDLLKIVSIEYGGEVLSALLKAGNSIMLNGQSIEFLGGVGTRLSDGDRVAVVPLVAGG